MSKYWDLPLVGNILRKLEVTTQEDIAKLNIGKLVEAGHIGPTKLAILLKLVRTAEEKRYKRTPITHLASDLDLAENADLPVLSSIGVIPARLKNIIKEAKIETLGELAEWHRKVKITDVKNYGRTTHNLITTLLNEIAEKGVQFRIFQSDKTPETGSEFTDLFLNSMTRGHEREVFVEYYINRKHGQEIAETVFNPPVSRQRVAQIIDRAFDTYVDSWGTTADSLLEPLVMAFDQMDDVVPLDMAMKLVGASRSCDIEILSAVASRPIYIPRSDQTRVAVAGTREHYLDLCRKWSSILTPLVAHGIDRSELIAALQERGVTIPEEHLADWMNLLVNTNLIDDPSAERIFASRARMNNMLADIVRRAGKPVNIHQIVEAYVEMTGHETNIRAITSHMQRIETVYKYSLRQWVHLDNIGMSKSMIDSIAAECKKRVPRNGSAANVRRLLAEVASIIPSAKQADPFVIRTAMISMGNLRAWRAGCDIAWDTDGAHRISIEDHIRDFANTAEEPFSLSQMVDEIVSLTGCLAVSVMVQIKTDGLLQIGYDCYIHPLKVFKSQEEFLKAIQTVESAIPDDTMVNCITAAQTVKLLDPKLYQHIETYGEDLIHALARHSTVLQTRLAGRMVWNKTKIASDVDFIFDNFIKQFDGYFSPRDVASSVNAVSGTAPTHYINRVLRDLMARKLITHVSLGNYRVCTWADNQMTFGF